MARTRDQTDERDRQKQSLHADVLWAAGWRRALRTAPKEQESGRAG
jgi:hypothetical protein